MATPYMTAPRFKLAGYGIDTNVPAPTLRATLQRATTMVNTWCNGSQLPQPFDFRGGTVTGEQHIFPIPSPLVAYPGSRRVFVWHKPLRTVTAFHIEFTTNYRIDLNPSTDIFVNTSEGWCEIVASQPTIIGYPPIGYWYGLYQPIARLDYTYGYQIAVTDDPCDAGNPTLYYAGMGQWDPMVAPVVKIAGAIQSSGYTVNYPDGSITFATAPTPGQDVTVSYTALLPDAISQATGIVAADLMAKSRNMARMPGLSSMKVAEITLTRQMGDRGRYQTKNGISIPEDAAVLLGSLALGSAA